MILANTVLNRHSLNGKRQEQGEKLFAFNNIFNSKEKFLIFHREHRKHVRTISLSRKSKRRNVQNILHHHKRQGLNLLIRSVSKVTTPLSNVPSVFQLFSLLVVCSSTISKGFDFVAFFASVGASSVCIRLSCLVRL